MATVGRRLLSSLLYSGSIQAYLKLGLAPYLFRDSEVLLYNLIVQHLSHYGKLPSPETVMAMPGYEDSLVSAPEPPSFYLAEVETRFMHGALKTAVGEANTALLSKNPEEAFDKLAAMISDLYAKKHRHSLFDFREAKEIILTAYAQQHTMGDEMGLMFGWPTLDNMTGGLRGGDFCAFVGRPASGKTFKLLYNALHAWKGGTGRVPLFISMEMNRLIICQRLAAMHSSKNLTQLLKGQMSKNAFDSMMAKLILLKKAESPFWIVDGNLTTNVDDIVLLAHQLNPSAVFVDGAYLLRHKNPKINKFEKITDNAEMLKQRVATDLDIPVVCSYQLNREAAKKKKKDEETGLEDIAGSDAIGQLSTIVLGLFQEEGVETMQSRAVQILKGRNGEVGRFSINWDFHSMNFTEHIEKPAEDLQFLG